MKYSPLTPIKRITLIAAAAASIFALSACTGGIAGSGDKKASGPIKLGMLAPYSGSESAFGTYMENGAKMAIKEINDAGGVLGQKLELKTADDGCDATQSVAAANKLVTEGVIGSVGGYCSGATLPTLPIFQKANIPMVIPAANSNKLVDAKQKNVFLINGTGTQQAEAAFKYSKKIGSKKVALLNDTTAYSKDLSDSYAKQAKQDGTLSVVLDQSATPGEKDYSANVHNVIGSGADILYWTGYYQEGGLITKQLKDAGFKGIIIVGDGSVDKKLAEIAGAGNTKNVVGTFTQTPDMLRGADDWIAKYKKDFKADPGPYSTQSYDAVRVMAEAIKNADSTDGSKIIDALTKIKDFKTFSGPLTFTPERTRTKGGFVIVSISDDGSFKLKDDLLN